MAEELRRKLSLRHNRFTTDLQLQLKELTDRLVECRKENDFIDTDIRFYNEELQRRTENHTQISTRPSN